MEPLLSSLLAMGTITGKALRQHRGQPEEDSSSGACRVRGGQYGAMSLAPYLSQCLVDKGYTRPVICSQVCRRVWSEVPRIL